MFLNVLGGFFCFVFLFLLLFLFQRGVLLGWGSLGEIQYFSFLTLFIFFILGMCIRKEACLFVCLHFCPKNEILISLLRVYCLVEHLVKEMDDLNDACVLDIVYFVEGKCSFLTNFIRCFIQNQYQ